jgi:hypothetical protein
LSRIHTAPNGDVYGDAEDAVSYFYFLSEDATESAHPDGFAFRQYVDALVAAEAVKARPRGLREILWEAGGAALQTLLRETPKPPMSLVFKTLAKKAHAWRKGGLS